VTDVERPSDVTEGDEDEDNVVEYFEFLRFFRDVQVVMDRVKTINLEDLTRDEREALAAALRPVHTLMGDILSRVVVKPRRGRRAMSAGAKNPVATRISRPPGGSGGQGAT
jgi:hypothetical protein